jgi:hypothetical protein
MEEKFLAAWENARQQAQAKGVRLRPMELTMANAHRQLGGRRESDGFFPLADSGLLKLSLEALAVNKAYTGLFTDEEANNALMRLLDAGYKF